VTPAPPTAPGSAGPLIVGSLCTGYGGLDIAVTAVLDAEVAWSADNDPHAAAVLAARWPGLRSQSPEFFLSQEAEEANSGMDPLGEPGESSGSANPCQYGRSS
jgi:hypothetical protein